MDRAAEEKTACLQKENSVPVCEKKKSGIPVPVWKVSQTHRKALAAVSEFQQNIQQNSDGHRPTQQRQPAPPTSARPDHPEKGIRPTQCCKSDTPLSSDVLFKAMPSTPQPLAAKTLCPASESKTKPGHSSARLVSLIEEQQHSGVEFQQDSSALQSILTDTGITTSSLGSVSEMFRPQRVKQGHRRPVYTPAKHTTQMRNSMYIMESRMSLIDSCNQYKQFLRQTRGLKEESESASPQLARRPQKVAVSESPLVKGMKAHQVKGSVFPQWSYHTLPSPASQQAQSTSSRLDTVVDGIDPRDPGREGLFGTPKTPVMAFSRVPVTPMSSKPGGLMWGTPGTPASAFGRMAVTPARRVPVQSASMTGPAAMQMSSKPGGLMWGTPGTPASAFGRMAVTPARRVPVQSASMTGPAAMQMSSKPGGLMWGTPGTPASAFGRMAVTPARRVPVQSASMTGPAAMQRPESMKKRLRWADILSSCSPDDQRTKQTAQPASSHSNTSTADTTYTPHSALKRDALTSADRRSSQSTTCKTVHPYGVGEASSAVAPRHAERWQDGRHLLPSSVGGLPTRLHVVREGVEGEGPSSEVRERLGQETAVGHFTAAARDERSSSVATERGVTPVPCDNWAAGTAPSQTDILKGLQVLEERERVIQREMQLHRMAAVQTDQEAAASNANHVSRSQASHSAAHHCSLPSVCQNPLSDDTMSLLHIVLKGPCFHLPQTSFDQSGVSGEPSLGLKSSAVQSPPSSTTGNLELRHHTSTTMVNSESSFCSVDSHTSTSGFKTSHSMYPVGHGSYNASTMTQHTGKVLSDIWPTKNTKTQLPESTLSFCSQGKVFGDKDTSNSLNMMLATDKAKAQQYDTNIESSQCLVSSSESESSMEYEVTLSNKVKRTLNQLCSHGAQSENDQHEHDSETKSCEMTRTQTQGNSEAAIEHQRQGMNMDVEKTDNEATPKNRETRLGGLKTSLAPLPGTVHEERSGRVNPVSVIVQPTARSPSLPTNHQQKTPNLPFSPPIWTTLALQCAALRCNRPQASSGTMHPIPAPAQDSSISLPPCTEPHAVVENLSYDCLSPESVKQDSPKYSANGSLRPVFRADNSSSSKRCPLQCSQDHGQGRKNSGDLFMEALLEDECALYAGRLKSFFRDLTSVCDTRRHPPDPVARILSEGDDMHFIPICEDGAAFSNYRSAPIENSAFVSYVPV